MKREMVNSERRLKRLGILLALLLMAVGVMLAPPTTFAQSAGGPAANEVWLYQHCNYEGAIYVVRIGEEVDFLTDPNYAGAAYGISSYKAGANVTGVFLSDSTTGAFLWLDDSGGTSDDGIPLSLAFTPEISCLIDYNFNDQADFVRVYGLDGLDTTPPAVSSTSPAIGATGVAITSAITATFSEAMDASTITTDTFTVSDGSSSVGGTVSYSDTTSTFTPSGSLSYSTTYTATITTGVKDTAGNAMASNYTWSFTTEAPLNTDRVANAGTDQSAAVGSTVTLDGRGSYDADGNLLTYSWSFTSASSGSNAALSDAATENPTFTADVVGTYVAQLAVNDGAVNGSPDTVTITASGAEIKVEVSIKPETINLKSKGRFKVVIEFPEPYNAEDVVLETVVCGGAHAIEGRFDDDDDNDDNRYVARFNVKDLSITANSKKEEVALTVSGELDDGTKFTGSDTVKVKGKK